MLLIVNCAILLYWSWEKKKKIYTNMNHQARRVIHDLDETIILKQPDFTFCCCVKKILMVVLASERGDMSRNSSD